jgi:hypothetical protein
LSQEGIFSVVGGENTDSELLHSNNFIITAPLGAGVLEAGNSFDQLPAYKDMEVGDILAAAAAQGGNNVDAAAAAAAAQGGNDA